MDLRCSRDSTTVVVQQKGPEHTDLTVDELWEPRAGCTSTPTMPSLGLQRLKGVNISFFPSSTNFRFFSLLLFPCPTVAPTSTFVNRFYNHSRFNMLLPSMISLALVTLVSGTRTITVKNNCKATIWPAIFTSSGTAPSHSTGWSAKKGSSVKVKVGEYTVLSPLLGRELTFEKRISRELERSNLYVQLIPLSPLSQELINMHR